MKRPLLLLGLAFASQIVTESARSALVFAQDFSGTNSVAAYYDAAAPTNKQFNDIGAEATGGTWTINGGALQLVRTGNNAATNGAGLTRHTDFAAAPGLLAVQFDLAVTANAYLSGSMYLEIGNYASTADYNSWAPTVSTFARLGINLTGGSTFRYEANGVTSLSTFSASGTTHHVSLYLNKSGAQQNYLGPDGSARILSANCLSLWSGTALVFDNYTAINGAGSALKDMRIRFGQVDAGTWKLDNFLVYDSLPSTTPQKIVLSPSMVTNESAGGDAGRLVDEQTLSGDPVNSPPGGAPATKFQPPSNGQTSWYYPLNAIIDLGAAHKITNIAFYDSNGTGNVTISAGTPFNWTPLVTDGQAGYLTWKKFAVSATTRYIQVSIASPAASPNEILLYGTPLGLPGAAPAPTTATPPTIDEFIGANTFAGEPLHRQEALGTLREYHNWMWCEGHVSAYPGYPNNENGFAPAWTGGDYDYFYRNVKAVGLTVAPAVQMNVLWLTGGNSALLNNKPIPINSGRSPTDPASYVEHADHLFQFAARYGSTTVADSLLKLRSNNARLTGLDQVRFYENWNEQNKWWEGRDAYFSPYEYAAMSSADYDGHLGAMGGTVGLKNADPNAKLVMAGLAGPDLDYIKAMKLWCDYNRGGSFPWAVINVHHYSNDGGQQFSGTSGISPEADDLKGRMETIRQYRDQYLPGVEFWVSEFGYDVNPGSKQHAPAIGTFSAEEVQGQWLVRGFLALAAAGVDRAMMYSLADQGPVTSTGIYATSGLVTQRSANCQPRTSWWYVYTMKNRLKGLRFEAEQASGHANVKIYRFKNAGNLVKAYVVWCPTSNQTSVNGYQLALQGSPATAHVVNMQSGDPDGVKTPLTITGGAVSVDVSERPVFVLVDHNDPDFQMTSKLVLTGSMVVNESGLGNATMMVDEQAAAGDPREPNGGGAPGTVWAPGNGTASAYIDLGQVYQIDRIFIRDVNAIGNLTIASGSPGNWTQVKVDPLDKYMTWNMHVVNISTRYLRFTRANGASNFSEVVIYGK